MTELHFQVRRRQQQQQAELTNHRLKYTLTFVVGVLIGGVTTACNNPVGPSYYECFTQPREYVTASGVHQFEIDRYQQSEPCPAVRID
jgi:hypothetical protein